LSLYSALFFYRQNNDTLESMEHAWHRRQAWGILWLLLKAWFEHESALETEYYRNLSHPVPLSLVSVRRA